MKVFFKSKLLFIIISYLFKIIGGVYFGRLVFPSEYPNKPPSIYIITPNGRFTVNKRLCFSMSDYHPELWNPLWSVSSILNGLLSFMVLFIINYLSIYQS